MKYKKLPTNRHYHHSVHEVLVEEVHQKKQAYVYLHHNVLLMNHDVQNLQ